MSDGINVVTAANEAYVPHAGAMLHSLFVNNPDTLFNIYFLHRQETDDGSIGRLAALCSSFEARFHPRSVKKSLLDGLPVGGWYIEEAWYRIVMPRVLPEVNRVIWLDSDVIVMSPINELWEVQLDGLPLAACPNAILYSAREGVKKLGVENRGDYFNTGVLLLDLERMRVENSEGDLRKAAMEKRKWIHFADQDVLNCVYHKRYRRLPLAWNLLTHSFINVPETLRVHGRREYHEAMRAPRIIHFTGRTAKKPWSYGASHPFRDEYLAHRKAAGWGMPEYKDRNLKNHIMRRMPLRVREIISAVLRGRLHEALSYMRQW